jgi:hypothetical protein
MGTSNFYKVNADKYYAVHMNDDEGNYTDIDFEAETDRIDEELEDRGYENVGYKDRPRRSDDAQVLGQLFVSEPDDLFMVEATVLLRAGYYEGANLDWEISIVPPMEWEDFSEFQDMNLKEQRDMVYNELLVASDRGYIDRKYLKQYEQITDALSETIENVIEKLRRDFGQIAQRTLIRTATFSNGNSIYSEVQP